ncbi:FeoA family protein [Glaciecola sp. 2405UD65-10]|jgi:ferrous iron transport protein A|uniref:FeoA family protein n=1 Tax=Glaciecola sp. 2405UD65-10 TaxID=3397244 RepID=UPI003B5B9C99
MTLWELSNKQQARVEKLHPDLAEGLQIRLSEMGFAAGEELTCMKRSPFSGPIVVQVQDCVYSLDKQLAQNIFIHP